MRYPRALAESLESRRLFATFTVDLGTDETDGDTGAGDLSLREAVALANANPDSDQITFAPGLTGQTLTLTLGEIAISTALSITGSGPTQLTISGGSASRLFNISDGNASNDLAVTIAQLALTNGAGTAGGALVNQENLTLSSVRFAQNSATDGGAIANDGSITLNAVLFSGNVAVARGGAIRNDAGADINVTASSFEGNTASEGGAIYNDTGGVASLINVTLQQNAAGNDGGAVFNAGSLVFTDATITENTANAASGQGGALFNDTGGIVVMNTGSFNSNSALSGGAVLNEGDASFFNVAFRTNSAGAQGAAIRGEAGSTLVVETSSMTGGAAAQGGGIFSQGTMTLASSTISGNTATGVGGGVCVDGGTVTIRNSTIAFNTAGLGNGDSTNRGGGVHISQTTITTVSTVFSNNVSGTGATPSDLVLGTAGLVSGSSANNLASAATTTAITNGSNGNIVGQEASLAPLRVVNGTEVHLLLPTSPAIDTGSNPQLLTTDQRGYPRVGGTAIDIGSAETLVYPTTAAPGRLVSGAGDENDVHREVALSPDGSILVFEPGNSVINLQERTGAPQAMSDPVIYVDPKDGLFYVAATTTDGFVLFQRSATGVWSARNLSDELSTNLYPSQDLATITTVGGLVLIAGITSNNLIVAFQQTGQQTPGNQPAFTFVNISSDLAAQGMTTPVLTNLIGYVPTWDSWHFAGIDSAGDIQGVWVSPASFTQWRVDNLSTITGAPTVTGQLAVTQTPWGGINLTGLGASGNVLTTWWVPNFGADWRVNDLTDMFGALPFTGGRISGLSTPWGGLSYAGLDAQGRVYVYWWAPEQQDWQVTPLVNPQPPSADRAAGELTSFAASTGTLNIFGASALNEPIRMFWRPGDAVWTTVNLASTVTRT